MSRERAYCECDAQADQGCAHAPDPCFQEAVTVLPDGEGIPTNVCRSCYEAQKPEGYDHGR